MPVSREGDLAEVGRRARRLQDLIGALRATATGPGVCIEVAADGRITALRLSDTALAQAIPEAHGRALYRIVARVAELRREFTADPALAALMRRVLAPGNEVAGGPGSAAAVAPGSKAAVEPGREAAVAPGREAAAEPGGEAAVAPGTRAAVAPRGGAAGADSDCDDTNRYALPPAVRARLGLR